MPDVQFPDCFLSYMSGLEPGLVPNAVGATCTNSVHGVRLKRNADAAALARTCQSPFVKLSCELEGHPLGGGMLKLEPREATRIILPTGGLLPYLNGPVTEEALATMREWRHYAAAQ